MLGNVDHGEVVVDEGVGQAGEGERQERELPPGRSEVEWLGERIKVFKTAVKDFKGLGGAFA